VGTVPSSQLATSTSSRAEVMVFRNDDVAFESWLLDHRAGYVLNTRDLHNPILHHAHCGSVKPSGTRHTFYRQKVCSDADAALRRWSEDRRYGVPTWCSNCTQIAH
jgi:hypothetical protein